MKKTILKQALDPFFISLFIIIVLSLAIFYLVYYPKKLAKNTKPCLDSTIDQITKIEIDQTILEKQNQSWVIASNDNLPTDQNKIKQLLSTLEQIKKDSIVSENKQYHQKYGLAEDSAINITALNNQKEVLRLLIGGVGPGFSGTYFRQPDKDTVYLSKIGLRSTIIQNNWKDLTITDFYSDQVSKVEINNKIFEDLEDEKVKSLINALTGLIADDIIRQRENLAQNNSNNIKIYLEDKEIELAIFTNEENFYAIKTNELNFIYKLDQTRAETIQGTIIDLLSS